MQACRHSASCVGQTSGYLRQPARRWCPSAFAWQQDRRGRSVARIIDRFRDDPQLLAEQCAVGGEQAGAVQQSLLVRLTVFLAKLAPVALECRWSNSLAV